LISKRRRRRRRRRTSSDTFFLACQCDNSEFRRPFKAQSLRLPSQPGVPELEETFFFTGFK
jgi:hypothetical protein